MQKAYVVYRVLRDNSFEVFYAYQTQEEAEACLQHLTDSGRWDKNEVPRRGLLVLNLRPKFDPQTHTEGYKFSAENLKPGQIIDARKPGEA